MASKKAVIGLVPSDAQAERLVDTLVNAGFAKSDISVLFPDKNASRDFAHEQNTKAPEGAAAGATIAGTLGGTIGLLAGIGALAIPGLGPFIAAGPIMATLSGAAVGATVGAISGALVGLGIPEVEAKQYEAKIAGGNILMSVHVEDGDERKRAKEVLESGGAVNVKVAGEQSVPSQDKDKPRARV
jgi:uncharacterized membrane protein